MADITDRPQSAPLTPEFEAAPLAERDLELTYRPLSLLALGGFGVCGLFAMIISFGGWKAAFVRYPIFFLLSVVLAPILAGAVCAGMGVLQPRRILTFMGLAWAGALGVLGLGGLLYFSGSDPWLLPAWVVVVPVAGLLLAAIGRTQITRSEGTLSGLPLCNWGMVLVGAFGLLYVAYYAATELAVRQQSGEYADQWLQRVHQSEIEKAFLMTLPPDNRPAENAELRGKLENLFSAGPANNYGDFRMSQITRLVQSTPADGKIEPLGLLNWDFSGGEYSARYGYRVHSLVTVCDVQVVVRGRESITSPPAYKGRQWYVDFRQTSVALNVGAAMTEDARALAAQNQPARDFINDWVKNLYRDNDQAYLLTLPPDQRSTVEKQRQAAGLALGSFGSLATRHSDDGWTKYTNGELVTVDQKIGWISPVLQDTWPTALKMAFRPGEEKPATFTLNPTTTFPIIEATPTGKTFTYDVKIAYGVGQKYSKPADVDGQIVLETDGTSLKDGHPQWQVKLLKLLRVRSAEFSLPGAGGPGGAKIGPPGAPPQR